MPAKKITGNKRSAVKPGLLKEITLQIATAAGMLRETLGEKKFDKRIKKAVRLLTDGLKSGGGKKPGIVKKGDKKPAAPTKKVAAKKATKKDAKSVTPKKASKISKNKTDS